MVRCVKVGGGLTTKFVSDIDNTVKQETVLRMKSCNLRTKINLFLKHVLIIISMNFSVNPIRKRNLTSFPHSYTKDDTKQMYIIFQCSFSKESKKATARKFSNCLIRFPKVRVVLLKFPRFVLSN